MHMRARERARAHTHTQHAAYIDSQLTAPLALYMLKHTRGGSDVGGRGARWAVDRLFRFYLCIIMYIYILKHTRGGSDVGGRGARWAVDRLFRARKYGNHAAVRRANSRFAFMLCCIVYVSVGII
jgi:hypothetical protein